LDCFPSLVFYDLKSSSRSPSHFDFTKCGASVAEYSTLNVRKFISGAENILAMSLKFSGVPVVEW